MAQVRKHTEETKMLMSKKRKEWLKQNPDKHPWRNKDKFQSVPCQQVKEFLREKNISFVEEFDPNIPDRFFSIDIALPDKKIALEINGNQHYHKNGSLQPYYQTRHDLLVSHGWTVYELHYSTCFNILKLDNLLDTLLTSVSVNSFDYLNFIPVKKIKAVFTCACGNTKADKKAISCRSCFLKRKSKIKDKPSKDELQKLIKIHPMTFIGKLYGVSDNAVRKWAKNYQIL